MIYHVFANRSNIGDWLSAKGIQMLIGETEITECLCDEPYVSETMETLSKATEDDLVVIGGGGLLMDYFVPFWESFKPLADKLRFCIWGIGCCDLKLEETLPPSKLISEIVAKSELCFVRDELSRSYLSDNQLPSPVPCPAINYIQRPSFRGNDLLHVVNYSTAGAQAYEAMRTIGQEYATEQGFAYRETNNRVRKNKAEEMERLLSLYAGADIVLSSALHGCIIGVAMGAKVLAVSGDRKIEAFMEAVGLGDWVIDQRDLRLLPERLKQISSQKYPEKELDLIRRNNEVIAGKIHAIMLERPMRIL